MPKIFREVKFLASNPERRETTTEKKNPKSSVAELHTFLIKQKSRNTSISTRICQHRRCKTAKKKRDKKNRQTISTATQLMRTRCSIRKKLKIKFEIKQVKVYA